MHPMNKSVAFHTFGCKLNYSETSAIGRSFADAPEIDGAVYLNGLTSVKPGDIIDAVVEEADEYDLWASAAE